MKFFNVLKANTFIEGLEQQVTALTEKLIKAESTINELQNLSKDVTEATMEHEAAMKQLVESHKVEVEKLEASYKQMISNLETVNKQTEKSVSAKAIDLMASLGVEAETIKTTVKDVSMTKPKGYTVIDHLKPKQ